MSKSRFEKSLSRLKNSLDKNFSVSQDLEVPGEPTDQPQHWSDECKREKTPGRGGFGGRRGGRGPSHGNPGPGVYGPGRWDPCLTNVGDPACTEISPWYKATCPCDQNQGIVEYTECCRNTPGMPPPMGNDPWDGNCDNPPFPNALCYRDTRNDPPESHGWYCCKDGQHIHPGNPNHDYSGGGGAMGQVPPPPKPPFNIRPYNRPGYGRPGYGRPGIIPNPNPGGGPHPEYINPCEGKTTNGKICCNRIPGHTQTRWRGFTTVPCVNPEYVRWMNECGEEGDSEEGGSAG